MTKRAWLVFALVVAVCSAIGYVAAPLPLAGQTQIMEGLRSTSSIVFGAMGAWLALLYAITTEQTRDRGWRNRVDHILVAMSMSGVVLVVVVLIAFASPVLVRFEVVQQNRETLLRLCMATVGALTGVQLWSLLLSFLPLLWASRARLIADRNDMKREAYYGSPSKTAAS